MTMNERIRKKALLAIKDDLKEGRINIEDAIGRAYSAGESAWICGWSADDVASSAALKGIKLNADDVDSILSGLQKHFDANVGMSWEDVENAVRTFHEDRKRN